MQLFYLENANLESTLLVEGQEHIHLVRALRKKVGDKVHITNGKGKLFEAVLVSSDKRQTQLRVERLEREEPSANELILAVAPTKNIARYEWMIEKAVEMGVRRIIPFVSFHSERKVIKQDRLQQIAVSAMKQSLQLHLPIVSNLLSYSDLLDEKELPANRLIAYCEEHTERIDHYLNSSEDAVVLIGPEGGFTLEEVKNAEKCGFKSISLGKNRLRTETAGIFAAASFYAKQ